ncbi:MULTISPECIES: leucine-rich repeat domain-containing protein [unclassified Fusibacter]|uniref:leucine-rich repeat domain-containing protein n=1 Tax=unclassified Fusibacter TaxID=2624464 RepID=UPI001013A927|nr:MULTISPECIES: leucine-rich repeat domain-containing protein [unclassified Fusibacter]MCK8060262.1 leucine-rich repeat domain-containing protein [Fusibacter sp. A2]NPE20449.1 leucine-rich repeat domain-containing protein [Fusibacter sp. A1]RXV63654.1 leucine-rich repeat domain-containing protein [Fusibacter sp. A1]
MSFYYKMVPGNTYCITGYTGNDVHVKVPTNIEVTILSDDIFKGHTEIESVDIPDTVTQLGGFVFDGCTGLKRIVLPAGLTDMWQYAMTRTSIEEIEIPGSVKAIVPFTFNQSKALKKVVFNEGTLRIDAWAFKDCTSLTDVYLSSSLTTISDKAFEGCNHVTLHYLDKDGK